MAEITNKVARIEHKSAPDASSSMESPNVAGTTAVRRRKRPLDLLGVTPSQMVEFGIKHNKETGEASEGLRWVRCPGSICNVYKDAPEDRVSSLEYEIGAEPVRVNGKIVTRHDVMLVRYPKEIDVENQRDIDREHNRVTQNLRLGAEGAMQADLEFDAHGEALQEMSTAEKKAMLARASDYYQQSGMLGPTRGKTLSEAIRITGGPDAVAREEESYRMGAAHREMSSEEFATMMTGQVPTSRAVRNFHGMGDSGLGKTTQQKVAATSAAGRRAAAVATPAPRRGSG